MKHSIMFVDDSYSVLESIKWMLKDENYHSFTFDNPLDALDKIKEAEFAVVVAEQSMLEMDVIEFFKKVKQRSPHTVGIIMASSFELDTSLDALDDGLIYRFIKKPWDDFGLKKAVKMTITYYEMNA